MARPLHYLAVENYRDGVSFLVEHGADPSTGNDFGQSAIVEAAQVGHIDMVDLLLRLGARSDRKALLAAVSERKRARVAAVLEAHGVLPSLAEVAKKQQRGKRR